MELFDRLLCMCLVRKANEGKAAGAASLAVFRNVDVDDFPNLTEQLTELLVRRGEIEVSYEYLA